MTEQQKKRFAEALNRLAGDEALLVEMACLVSDDAPQLLEEIESHLDAGEAAEAASSGHKLKGMFSTFETGPPITQLQDMIQVARSENLVEAREAFRSCKPKLQSLMSEILQLSESMGTRS